MTQQAATYIPDEQHERWQKHAEQMGMSNSKWIESMVEAGLKKFSREIEPDRTHDDLRQYIIDLRKELQQARERIQSLEKQLYITERQAIIDYLEDSPGAEYHDVVQHIINTANSRVARLLDEMEKNGVEIDETGRMYVQ